MSYVRVGFMRMEVGEQIKFCRRTCVTDKLIMFIILDSSYDINLWLIALSFLYLFYNIVVFKKTVCLVPALSS